ncbi:MAG TPA: Maf family nucleotide pyrophosphatase [Gaiellaceae bacterium]|nr:Maf family nucleotide pyrophosphatase [Gaiellaceae bacterium]
MRVGDGDRAGEALAGGGDLAVAQALTGAGQASEAAPPTLLLASTSPQRRAILEQLRIPFEAVRPSFVEDDRPDADPVSLVRAHARGKARAALALADGRPVLGVDTAVACEGVVYGKPAGAAEAAAALRALAGRSHVVVSGLALVGPGWEVLEHEVTRVWFRSLSERDIDRYVASGEWEGRAGAYAIQGLGASLVERVEGDYLNVVGLPAALLVRLLAERFPGVYGFG